MNINLFHEIRGLRGFRCGHPASEAEILKYEQELDLRFPENYRTFLHTFGFASWAGNKITGISEEPYYDLLAIHKLAKERQAPPPRYCIILDSDFAMKCLPLSDTGSVFQRDRMPTNIEEVAFSSFEEYVHYRLSCS